MNLDTYKSDSFNYFTDDWSNRMCELTGFTVSYSEYIFNRNIKTLILVSSVL